MVASNARENSNENSVEERLAVERKKSAEEDTGLQEEEETRARIRLEVEARARAELEERVMMQKLHLQRIAAVTKRKVFVWTWAAAAIVVLVNIGVTGMLHSHGLQEARLKLETEKKAWERWREGFDKDLAGTRRDFMDIETKVDAARNETASLKILLETQNSDVAKTGTRAPKSKKVRSPMNHSLKSGIAATSSGQSRESNSAIILDRDPLGDEQDLFGEDQKKKRR